MIKSPYATNLTRNGTLNAENRKPFRTKEQKAEAQLKAWKTKGGFFVTTAPVSHH